LIKTEILQQAEIEGIELTKSMLNRYIKYGFLTAKKEGGGYKKPPVTTYPQAMKIIRYVDQLKNLPHIKQENIIFVLFWKGLPVNIEKLKNIMLDQRNVIMKQFEEVAKHSSEPQQVELWAIDLAKDAVKFMRKPGKPSQEVKKSEADWSKKFVAVALLIHDLVYKNTLSKENAKKWTDLLSQNDQTHKIDLVTLKEIIIRHIDYSSWIQQDRFLEIESYVQIQEIIKLVKEYIACIEGEASLNFQNSQQKLKEILGYTFLSENPFLIYVIIFVLLASGQLKNIKKFLSNSYNFECWQTFWNQT